MLGRHCINVMQMFCVCWIITAGIRPILETNRAQTEKKQKIGTDVDKYM